MYLGLNNLGLTGLRSVFSPSTFFQAGEQGVWYDPSDFSTMYQDSTGITPVTTTGQPVGLLLDKRLGLVRSSEQLISPYTGAASGDWSIVGLSSVQRAGAITGGQVTLNLNTSLVAGKFYEISCTVSGYTGDGFTFYLGGTNAGTIAANGSFRALFSASSGGSGLAVLTIAPWAGTIGTVTITNISVKLVNGNHASQPTTANRPLLQQDTSGNYYLAFNGTNSFMSTPGVCDFSASDKVLIVTGVLKAVSQSGSFVCELGPNVTVAGNAGTFALDVNGLWANGDEIGVGINGSGTVDGADSVAGTFTAGTARVISAIFDLAQTTLTAEVAIHINKVNQTFGTPQGTGLATGNLSSTQILNIGARSTPTFFLSGRIYGLLIRGTLSSSLQISQAETWMGSKTGVSL